MPDIGLLELLLVGVIAFLVLGPERMPELFSQVGRVVRKGRSWISDVKRQIDEETSALSNPVTEVKDALSDNDISSFNDELMKNLGQTIDPTIASGSTTTTKPETVDENEEKQDEASRESK